MEGLHPPLEATGQAGSRQRQPQDSPLLDAEQGLQHNP